MSQMHKKLLGIGPLSLAFFVVVLGFVLNSSALAVPISPDKYFLDIEDDSVIENEITVFGKQDQDGTRTVYLTVLGMSKTGEEDQRDFFVVDPALTEELAASINLSETEVQLAPGETVVVPWTLAPHPDLRCGTNLAAIVVTETPVEIDDDDGTSAVSFESEVISQVHANVNYRNGGECDNSVNLSLVEFKIDQGVSVFNHGNVPFVTRVQNTGNLIGRNPRGFVEVFGFGDKVTIPFNEGGLDIYPGTTRLFNDAWVDEDYPEDGNFFSQFLYELTHLRIGRYEARLGVTKNVEPDQIVESIYFWVIPWKIVFVLLLIVAIIVVLAVMLARTMQQNKKLSSGNNMKKPQTTKKE